jgi:aspartate/methionine/tyrosine aminotransferase
VRPGGESGSRRRRRVTADPSERGARQAGGTQLPAESDGRDRDARTAQRPGSRRARRRRALLHDLAYADLDFSTRLAPSIFDTGIDAAEVKKFAVEVFSMSKSYNMPGWRIATMVGNERLIGALSHLKTYMDYGTFIPLQHASAWALDNGDALVDEIRELYRGRAEVLVRGLLEAGWGTGRSAERNHVRVGAFAVTLERSQLARRHSPAD